MTLDDITAILSALKGISDTLEYRELDSAIEKIYSLMPVCEKGKQVHFSELLAVDILPWGYRKKQKDFIQMIFSSVQQCRKIKFLYRNLRGESVTRTVEPMTLAFKGFAWYLFAFCTLRNDFP